MKNLILILSLCVLGCSKIVSNGGQPLTPLSSSEISSLGNLLISQLQSDSSEVSASPSSMRVQIASSTVNNCKESGTMTTENLETPVDGYNLSYIASFDQCNDGYGYTVNGSELISYGTAKYRMELNDLSRRGVNVCGDYEYVQNGTSDSERVSNTEEANQTRLNFDITTLVAQGPSSILNSTFKVVGEFDAIYTKGDNANLTFNGYYDITRDGVFRGRATLTSTPFAAADGCLISGSYTLAFEGHTLVMQITGCQTHTLTLDGQAIDDSAFCQ